MPKNSPCADVEGDAAQRAQLAVLDARERVGRALLERVDAVLRDAERLVRPRDLDDDGGSLRRAATRRPTGDVVRCSWASHALEWSPGATAATIGLPPHGQPAAQSARAVRPDRGAGGTLAVAAFMVVMPLVWRAPAPVVCRRRSAPQHQRAETLSYLLAFAVLLPLAALAAQRLCAASRPGRRRRAERAHGVLAAALAAALSRCRSPAGSRRTTASRRARRRAGLVARRGRSCWHAPRASGRGRARRSSAAPPWRGRWPRSH